MNLDKNTTKIENFFNIQGINKARLVPREKGILPRKVIYHVLVQYIFNTKENIL